MERAPALAGPRAGADREKSDVRLSATDIETGLVDLSGWGLREVMALSDPQVVQAQDTLLRHLVDSAVGLRSSGGGDGSPYFAVLGQDAQEACGGREAATADRPGRTEPLTFGLRLHMPPC